MFLLMGFVANLFELYILKNIINSFCIPKFKNTFIIYIVICLCSILSTAAKILISNILPLLAIIFIIFVFFSIFYKPIKHVALSIIIWSILGQCIDWLIALVISIIFHVTIFEVYYISHTYVIIGFFFSLIIKYNVVYFVISKRYTNFIEKTFSLYQYIFFVLSLFVMLNSAILFNNLMNNKPVEEYFYVYFFSSIVFLFVYLVFIFDKLILIAKENADNRMISEQNKNQKLLIDEVETLSEYLKQLNHDYIHHLNHLQSIVQSGSNDDAEKYVKLLVRDYSKLINFGFINNKPALSLLIMQKIKYAEANDIEFKCKVLDFLETTMSDTELNVILSNLLDNAIEAVNKLKSNKKITLDIYTLKDSFFIELSNSFNGELCILNDIYTTTKINKTIHGYGIKSVKRIVENRDGLFHVDVTFSLILFKTDAGNSGCPNPNIQGIRLDAATTELMVDSNAANAKPATNTLVVNNFSFIIVMFITTFLCKIN